MWFSGTFRDVGRITVLLEKAQEQCNLITPATSIGSLPEGWEVSVSSLLVNVDRDTYKAEDAPATMRCLGRTALDQIAAAAAVSWEPRLSGRQDDGRDPRYCRYLVTGRYRHFDGQWVTRPDEYEIDLRDPSPTLPDGGADYVKICLEAERDNNRDPMPRLARVRRDILSLTITKARNRALRDLGIRGSYTYDELARPFVVIRMAFTGATEDVELRRQFALLNAQRMLGAESALYGQPETPVRALPPAQTSHGSDRASQVIGVEDRPLPRSEVSSRETSSSDPVRPATQQGWEPATSQSGTTAREGQCAVAPGSLGQARSTGPVCDYCGDTAVTTSDSGAIRCCSKSKCVELARADAVRNHDLLPVTPGTREGTPTAALGRAASYPARGSSPTAPGPRRPAPPAQPAGGARASGFRVPGKGPEGGSPIEEASTEVLAEWEQTIRKKLRSGRTPEQYRDQDERLVEALRRELESRAMEAAELQGEIPH